MPTSHQRGLNVANMSEIRPNLGLRDKATRALLSISELSGLTVISTKARDKILESAPWLGPYFLIAETTKHRIDTDSRAADDNLNYKSGELADLRRRYIGHPACDHVQWGSSEVEAQVSLQTFRSDNLYVFQSRRYPPWVFYATAAYVKEVDRLDLWSRLDEDGRWGAEVFDFHGKAVSRDLLDSIIEMNFLERHLGLSSRTALEVLDIGAGYGRLAHRMASAFANLRAYYCVDAVPESTFISDYYLKARQMTDRCTVVPLDKLGELQPAENIGLAINIHSFPECRASVIEWWLHQLAEMRIPWLFIASSPHLGLTSHEGKGVRKDFQRALEKTGFRLFVKESKFESAPVLQNSGLYPADYYLFKHS
jgi:hypothetical protein